MSRRTNHDFDELPYDVPIPASSVMFNSDGTVSLETAGEAPIINRGRRRNQYHDPHAKREAMLHELAAHLADLVEAGEMSDQEANEWYSMKADQWAQGLNRGRRSNAKPGLVELINIYNDATDPGAYRSDEEHEIERERAREALRAIRRHYVEGVDYKELSNGALWPISRNRGRRRNAEMSFDEYWFDRGRRSGLSEDWDDYMKAWGNIPDAKRLKSTRDLIHAGEQFRRGWQVGREEHNKRLAWGRRR